LTLYKPRVLAYRAKPMSRRGKPKTGAFAHFGREQNVNSRYMPRAGPVGYVR
jgi:hypothetical protein